MDSSSEDAPTDLDATDAEGEDDADGEASPKVHYSTGRLTAAQAAVVGAWRKELTVKSDWPTSDGRPRASSSDCLAAAVIDLLDKKEPGPHELIRYAARIRETLRHRTRKFTTSSGGSFYLPEPYADRLDRLLLDAHEVHVQVLDDASREATATYPDRSDATARVMLYLALAAEAGVPSKVYKLPAGTIARMAIDRWARKSPTRVIALAVDYAETSHQQPHRHRDDMAID